MHGRAHRSECLGLLRELGAPVCFIVLPSHAYEHKVFVPPFQRRFPAAQVFVSPECVHFSLLPHASHQAPCVPQPSQPWPMPPAHLTCAAHPSQALANASSLLTATLAALAQDQARAVNMQVVAHAVPSMQQVVE